MSTKKEANASLPILRNCIWLLPNVLMILVSFDNIWLHHAKKQEGMSLAIMVDRFADCFSSQALYVFSKSKNVIPNNIHRTLKY